MSARAKTKTKKVEALPPRFRIYRVELGPWGVWGCQSRAEQRQREREIRDGLDALVRRYTGTAPRSKTVRSTILDAEEGEA